MTRKRTCAAFFADAVAVYCGNDAGSRDLFAAGFIFGQAEKVYLGSCRAAMFRPFPEEYDYNLRVSVHAAKCYGLAVTLIDAGSDKEIWLSRRANKVEVVRLRRLSLNSPAWHRWRARLCGIPAAEVSTRFHLRPGYKRAKR